MQTIKDIKHHLPMFFATGLAIIMPTVAFAVTAPTDLKSVALLAISILKGLAGILFSALAVGLVYGIVLYFANSDNEQKRAEIKGYLLWGVIGISVALGLWGILAILSSTFGWGGVGIPLLRPPS